MSATAGVRARTVTDRGISESVQWAVLAPVILLLVIGAVQVAVVLHGRSVVAQAALAGAEAQAVAGGGNGDSAARRVAAGSGVEDVDVRIDNAGRWVTVTVRGQVASLLPGLGAVSAAATSPVER